MSYSLCLSARHTVSIIRHIFIFVLWVKSKCNISFVPTHHTCTHTRTHIQTHTHTQTYTYTYNYGLTWNAYSYRALSTEGPDMKAKRALTRRIFILTERFIDGKRGASNEAKTNNQKRILKWSQEGPHISSRERWHCWKRTLILLQNSADIVAEDAWHCYRRRLTPKRDTWGDARRRLTLLQEAPDIEPSLEAETAKCNHLQSIKKQRVAGSWNFWVPL